MSDTMLILLAILAVSVIGPMLVRLRNNAFSNSAEGEEAQKKLEEFAQRVVTEDENVRLKDYSHITKTMLVMTDKGLHYCKMSNRGNEEVSLKYRQFSKCEFQDYRGMKTRYSAGVHRILLKTAYEKYVLTCFPQEEQIAQILMDHGY